MPSHFASNDALAAHMVELKSMRPSGLDPCFFSTSYLPNRPCRAASALKLGQWASALQDTEAALAAEPRWVKAMYRRAAALQGLGRLAPAVAAAQQALQIEPSNREVQALLKQLQQAQSSHVAAPGQQQELAETAAPPAAGALLHSGPAKPPPTAALLPPLLARSPWEHVPAADGVDENLLLLLHGLGDRPAAFAALARRMALPQVAAFLHAHEQHDCCCQPRMPCGPCACVKAATLRFPGLPRLLPPSIHVPRPPAPPSVLQTSALALGGPQEVPFSDGGRSWYTVFTPDFELIQVGPSQKKAARGRRRRACLLWALQPSSARSSEARLPYTCHNPPGCTAQAQSATCWPFLPLLRGPLSSYAQGRAGEQRRTRSLAQTVSALQQLLAALQRTCGHRLRCVHLLGFSQVRCLAV